MMIFSFIGFADSAYLSSHALFGTPVKCTITHGCSVVLDSAYSTIFDIPLPIFGVLYYLTIFFGAMVYREFGSKKTLAVVSLFTAGGFLMSLWLVSVQLFILHTICQYCMLSAATSTTLFVLGLITYKKLSMKPPVLTGDQT